MDRARIEETVVKLSIFTIVLDGEPYIEQQLPIFQQLKCDWKWIVIEGAAMNHADTSWCKPQEPRLSEDGTNEYLLEASANHQNVIFAYEKKWQSKTSMVNTALSFIHEPCVLMEIDADEIWRPWQLEAIVDLFHYRKDVTSMMFPCRYYVGENLVLKGHKCYGDYDYEWLRAWRFTPGMRFKSHEPPVLDGDTGKRLSKDETRSKGLMFDHHAYSTEAQVAYKEAFYGYTGLLDGWRRLQEVKEFPVPLREYFPQVKDDAMVVKV